LILQMPEKVIALVDGDILCWRCAASCEPTKEKEHREPVELAILRLDEITYRILSETAATEQRIFLSGSENFRYSIYKNYKANRRGAPRPAWLDACREFLVREWGAEITVGYEADDGMAIAHNEQSVVISIDKDFNQLTGQHYNFITKAHYSLDYNEAALEFWSSVIQGDRSDNIPGVKGMGPVKAKRALLGLSPEEMESRVRSYYDDERQYLLNCRLLRLLRSEDEYYQVLEQISSGYWLNESFVEEAESTAIAAEDSF
jgi:5'-3' exonuclease